MVAKPALARARGRDLGEQKIAESGTWMEGLCGERTNKGKPCPSAAGWRTQHPGFGPCATHGGNSMVQDARGAWIMAHAMARSLGVTPWEALLHQVRRQAGVMAFLDQKVGEATCDEDLTPGGSHAYWYQERQREGLNMAKYAKMAIDAGIAQYLVDKVEAEATSIATVLLAVMNNGELGLSDEQMVAYRGIVRKELLALDARQTDIIEGVTITDGEEQ